MGPLFVLIHSPLVGPFTWAPAAKELRGRGEQVLVPELVNPMAAPFWPLHVESAALAIAEATAAGPIVLIGHSGAGPLLPSIAKASKRPLSGYIYVDAGLPARGESCLAAGSFADYLLDLYRQGDRFPNWTEEDLKDEVPDAQRRMSLIAELRPKPFAFWEEALPAVKNWEQMASAYLQFTPTYAAEAEQARRLGWPHLYLGGGHFHMLVDAAAVVDSLLDLYRRIVR